MHARARAMSHVHSQVRVASLCLGEAREAIVLESGVADDVVGGCDVLVEVLVTWARTESCQHTDCWLLAQARTLPTHGRVR